MPVPLHAPADDLALDRVDDYIRTICRKFLHRHPAGRGHPAGRAPGGFDT
jgi:hypothetical protein